MQKNDSLFLFLRIFWFAQLASCLLLFALIYLKVVPQIENSSSETQMIFVIFGFTMLFAAPLSKRLLTSGLNSSTTSQEEKQGKYLLATLISLSLAESVAVTAFLANLYGAAQSTSYMLCAAAVLAVLTCAPKKLEIQ